MPWIYAAAHMPKHKKALQHLREVIKYNKYVEINGLMLEIVHSDVEYYQTFFVELTFKFFVV